MINIVSYLYTLIFTLKIDLLGLLCIPLFQENKIYLGDFGMLNSGHGFNSVTVFLN